MEYQLKTEWKIESAQDLYKCMGMTDGTFEFVPPVKWYQIKRWKLLFNPTKDYLKSRLYFLETTEEITRLMEIEIEEEIEREKGKN